MVQRNTDKSNTEVPLNNYCSYYCRHTLPRWLLSLERALDCL
jgi:hypothetical protein